MAGILSKQYESVFSIPKPHESNYNFHPRDCESFSDLQITLDMIKNAINEIKPSSAPGPDSIPAHIYKQYAEELAYPILCIWRQSLDTGKLPEGQARALITPIYKGGDKSNPANYRPVALTNHLTKIFERILRKKLAGHIDNNNLMNNSQHGFREGRSTASQLLSYYDSILTMLEEGTYVDAVYLDFAKAFDKVDHNILLTKIHGLGIRGKLLTWLERFLKHRVQQVRIGKSLSEEVIVRSGVPQRSVIGPLLFLIMMIDINKDIQVALGSFADDTRLWQSSRSNLMQSELDKMYKWASDNNMEYNGKKFEVLRYGTSEGAPNYKSLDGSTIKQNDSIKDLGVHMSENVKFDYHINSVVKTAQSMSAWVLRVFKTRKTLPMLTLLKTMVVSKAEYASILWAPSDQRNINKLENIQRRMTGKFEIFRTINLDTQGTECTTNYWERLKTLKIYSLERRRERFMILYMYKIVIELAPNPGFILDYNDRTKRKVIPKIK